MMKRGSRRMKTNLNFVLLTLLASSLIFPALVFSQPLTRSIKVIPTVTLLVKQYGEMENELQSSLIQGDRQKAMSFLADDFEERQALSPNSPIPKKDWLATMLKSPQEKNFAIKAISAHKYGDIIIVSFKQTFYRDLQQQPVKTIFIVDVWKKENSQSQLKVRYSSLVS